MIRRGYTKYPLFPKGNHCPAAAKVFNTTTEDYRVGHRPWLTYINPTHASLKFSSAISFAKEYHRFVWRSLLPFLLQNSVILWILFPIRINSMHFIQDYTTHNFTVLSSRPYLCPTENGTACFYLRVCQVTDGASMGPRDVITMVYRDLHNQTCRQALLSTMRLPLKAEPQWPECLVTLSPLHLPPKAGTLAVLSPHTANAEHC